MEQNPKRRKNKDNPYTILKDKNSYFISFKDVLGNIQKISITEELYQVFNEFELKELSQMNEFDRHIEHSKIYENNLEKRMLKENVNLEDDFIEKATFEEVKRAIEILPEIQKRRIKKYYFDDKNEYQIAEEEGTTQQAVNYTLTSARNNLKKILKKFQN